DVVLPHHGRAGRGGFLVGMQAAASQSNSYTGGQNQRSYQPETATVHDPLPEIALRTARYLGGEAGKWCANPAAEPAHVAAGRASDTADRAGARPLCSHALIGKGARRR